MKEQIASEKDRQVERRRSRRKPSRAILPGLAAGKEGHFAIEDVSISGICVRAIPGLEIGDAIRLDLPSGNMAACRVRRIFHDEIGTGYGCAFIWPVRVMDLTFLEIASHHRFGPPNPVEAECNPSDT